MAQDAKQQTAPNLGAPTPDGIQKGSLKGRDQNKLIF